MPYELYSMRQRCEGPIDMIKEDKEEFELRGLYFQQVVTLESVYLCFRAALHVHIPKMTRKHIEFCMILLSIIQYYNEVFVICIRNV